MHAIYFDFVFLFHGFLCECVRDIICNISQRSNDRLSVLSLSSVLSSAVAVLSASRIVKYALFQRERHWTLAMSRLKEPQEKLAVTWNVPSMFLSSIKNDTQCLSGFHVISCYGYLCILQAPYTLTNSLLLHNSINRTLLRMKVGEKAE